MFNTFKKKESSAFFSTDIYNALLLHASIFAFVESLHSVLVKKMEEITFLFLKLLNVVLIGHP